MDNTFEDNGAWGQVIAPYPNNGGPCTGGVKGWVGAGSCLFDESGDALIDNTFVDNGFFGNPTNGDYRHDELRAGSDRLLQRERRAGRRSRHDRTVERSSSSTRRATDRRLPRAIRKSGSFTNEVLCDSGVMLTPGAKPPCLPTDHYPRLSKVVMHRLPKHLATMPNPCAGVPANPWCRAKQG